MSRFHAHLESALTAKVSPTLQKEQVFDGQAEATSGPRIGMNFICTPWHSAPMNRQSDTHDNRAEAQFRNGALAFRISSGGQRTGW